jgi:protein-tyrosine kinase
MSKIEKALKRARGQQSIVPFRRTGETESGVSDRSESALTSSPRAAAIPSPATSGSIARMRETSVRESGELVENGIIHPEIADNPTVQAFREIRTRVLQRTQGRNAVILVTSVTNGGGNSFVALNLAVAFALDAGRTALLVEANLRNPSLQHLLPTPEVPGLTDYVEDAELDVAAIIHPVGIERLRVIPCGQRRRTVEHFTSERVQRLFSEIRGRYSERFVFVDAPMMAESADARILAELSDYVLLVVPYGKGSSDAVDTCVKSIPAGKFLGIVFNNDLRPPDLNWRFVRSEVTEKWRRAGGWVWERLTTVARKLWKRQADSHGG